MDEKKTPSLTKKQTMTSKVQEIEKASFNQNNFSFIRKSSIKITQVLKITGIEAKISRSSLEQSESTDSFVVFQHSGLKVKTATVKKTNNPKFTDELSLSVVDLKEPLEIIVYEIQKKTEKESSEIVGKNVKTLTHLYYGEKEEISMFCHPRVEITFKLEATNFGRLRDFFIKVGDYSEIDVKEMQKKQVAYEKLSEIHNATNKMVFDEDRLDFILSKLDGTYLQASDVTILLNCLRFRHYQYLLCEELIPKIIDIKNYSHVKGSLTFSDDKDTFEQEVLYYYMKKLKLNYTDQVAKSIIN